MRLMVAAVGRLKDGPERELLNHYRARFEALSKRVALSPVAWQEIGESRAASVAQRQQEEGTGLLKLAREADTIIVLDERGKALTSDAFARHLAKVRDGGAKSTAILIGGPDGLAPDVREAAQLVLSLGAITLPHGLARIVLAEQLYRAATILLGHPYHRG
jgi:23S rRNA (pseudouridine1915-N3)-methyltransferase